MLEKGTKAPDFSLYESPDKQVSLNDYKGKKLIIAFYPADWSPVCGDQIGLYNESLRLFEKYEAQIIGISVDSRWCHKAYSETRKLDFPLLADFEPKGAISKLYDAYDENRGESRRALYVIDEDGIIQWSYLSPVAVNPGADGILDALESLKK